MYSRLGSLWALRRGTLPKCTRKFMSQGLSGDAPLERKEEPTPVPFSRLTPLTTEVLNCSFFSLAGYSWVLLLILWLLVLSCKTRLLREPMPKREEGRELVRNDPDPEFGTDRCLHAQVATGVQEWQLQAQWSLLLAPSLSCPLWTLFNGLLGLLDSTPCPIVESE